MKACAALLKKPCAAMAGWLIVLCPLPAATQVATTIVRDGRLGTGPTSALVGAGQVASGGESYRRFAIPETFGARAGANLFHSFSRFDIGQGDGAVFTLAAPAANVIARVTGGQASAIHGLLSLDPGAAGGTPALFFVNPAGITFGAGAVVDVPGAFHASTANHLAFADGKRVDGNTSGSSLSSAAPAAFGFVGNARASILVRDGASIVARPRFPVSVTAGDITIDNGYVQTSDGGTIRMAAVGAPAVEVPLAGPLPPAQGLLTLANDARIYSTANERDGGSIALSAGDILLDGGFGYSRVVANTGEQSAVHGGSIDIAAAGSLTLSFGADITVGTQGQGHGGDASVRAGSVLIDGTANGYFTGIVARAFEGSTGNSGRLDVAVQRELSILNAGEIRSYAHSSGSAGSVKVHAGTIHIDGNHVGSTGISSVAQFDSSGAAGGVEVRTLGAMKLDNGASIGSSTLSVGNAGPVTIDVGLADPQARLSVLNGSSIASQTDAAGNASPVTIRAGSILLDGGTSDAGLTWVWTGGLRPGVGRSADIDIVAREGLTLQHNARILANIYSAGNGGAITIDAGDIRLDGSGSIQSASLGDATGNSGNVTLRARNEIAISGSGYVWTESQTEGTAGHIRITAANLAIAGSFYPAGIGSRARGGGAAGNVEVVIADYLFIGNQGFISSDTWGPANSGTVRISAGDLWIDPSFTSGKTGIFNEAYAGSSGNAGGIELNIARGLTIQARSKISSNSDGVGNAGPIRISADEIVLDSPSASDGTQTGVFSNATGPGNGGDITVNAQRDLRLRGSFISSNVTGAGHAGNVAISAENIVLEDSSGFGATGFSSTSRGSGAGGNILVQARRHLSIMDGAIINAGSFGSGDAGTVQVRAHSFAIDGKGNDYSLTGIFSGAASGGGNGGNIDVQVADLLEIRNRGAISSHTQLGAGHAGNLTIAADRILIDGQGSLATGIVSDTYNRSSGNAGSIGVAARKSLEIINGGRISSETAGPGKAGQVSANAETVMLDRGTIRAGASAESGGVTGNVSVHAASRLSLANGSELSIRNAATIADPGAVSPTTLSVSAPVIELRDSTITAASLGNVAASRVAVDFGERLMLQSSSINTSANDGNGGAVSIEGAGLVDLRNAQVATSVQGLSGNGGDIALKAGTLLLQTGFVQANTAARGAAGGNVSIDVATLLPSGNTLFVGGADAHTFLPDVFGFNVIQAAAPTGLSGAVAISSPALDVAGSLVRLNAGRIDAAALARSPCDTGGGSSLALAGRGGLPPRADSLAGTSAEFQMQAPGQQAALALPRRPSSLVTCRTR